ncbi:ATP-binding protein [Actinoplanes sp. Pm04-4]|uniref:histidine kinase n=1 Tax=Paractinoplanes pyxinae TaxID=2997416 RepID=A0ABT4B3N3_9ACTN|nr:ATP-binding protein [Actinoplanes pyxinae]MCY1141108.1 ATP-binding protein [Actinoplanes pyxinae]
MGPTAGTTGADGRLSDAVRLRRLGETGMLGQGRYPSLDRLARAAAHQLRTARAVVSLVGADSRTVAGQSGPPAEHTFCRLVVDSDAPVLVCDARTDDRVAGHPATAGGVIAYAGFPIRSPDGYPLAAFGVLDDRPRDWEPRELLLIEDLAAAAESEMAHAASEKRLRERLEQGDEHERAFLQALLDSLDTGVGACDEDGRLTLFNQALRDIHGTGAADLPAEDWPRAYDLYHPDGRTLLRPDEVPLAQAYAGKRVDHAELVIAPAGEAPRRFTVNARPLETPDGQRLGAVVAMHDITEQRRAETFREVRLAVARGLADSHSAGEAADRTVAAVGAGLEWAVGEFWQIGTDAITRVGSWAAPGHGIPDRPQHVRRGEGLAGHIWASDSELWLPEVLDDPRTVLRAAQVRAAGLHSAIGVPVRSDDRVLGVLLFFTAVPLEPDPDVLDLLDGVCAHLGRHMERRRAEELALELARVKDELVGMVSHELRNPLSAIRSYSETLLDDPALTGEQRHLAEVIDRRSTHMQHLVDDLLDLARLEAGQMSIDPQPLSAARLIRETVQAQRPAAEAKQLTVTVDAPRHLPVLADPVRLRQVLDNLVSNAVKYTPEGGAVTVTARLTGDVVIEVADTGIGVPPGEHHRLFDRFFRASNAVRKGTKGTGLGLAITKAIVDAHGGHISAAPAATAGSVFTVVLPASHD